mmetsp:Transcript_23377/g.38946  ORF Transcript_23377/g.38946 Transcript_23377/m.38946 type:complete len:229 (-) Transcript_23377:1251-1937(-)
MQEQTQIREAHGHVVLLACIFDLLVSHAASRLSNKLNTVLGGMVDGISEWEEGVAGNRHPLQRGQKSRFLFCCQWLRRALEVIQPNRHLRSGDVPLNVTHARVHSVLSLDRRLERQVLHFGVLAEEPRAHFAAGEFYTVYTRLLTGTHPHHLSISRISDRIALRVLDRNRGKREVSLGRFCQLSGLTHDLVGQMSGGRKNHIIPLLGEAYAKQFTELFVGGSKGLIRL